MAKISICMPAYNVALYVDKCIGSILTQNFDDFELIVTEDCSTDDTLRRLEAWVEKDSRLKVIKHQKNSGVAQTYNDALQKAVGEYVAFIDSDDYVLPGYLENLYRAAEENQADVVQMSFESFTEENGQETTKMIWPFPAQPLSFGADLSVRAALFCPVHLHIAPWGKIYRRSFLERRKLHFNAAPLALDALFHYQSLISAPRYIGLPLHLYRYLMRSDSYSHKKIFPKQTQDYFLSMVRQMSFLSDWLKSVNLYGGDAMAERQALDGYIQHYRYFFARQAKDIGVDKVLTVLEEMAEKVYGENAAAFQSTMRMAILSRLREIS